MENVLNFIKVRSRSFIIIILSIALIISISANINYWEKEQQLKKSLHDIEKQWNDGVKQWNEDIQKWNDSIDKAAEEQRLYETYQQNNENSFAKNNITP